MKIQVITLFLALMTAGCQKKTVTPRDMIDIQKQSSERNPGLSRYGDTWNYIGSKDGYDHVLFSGVIFEQHEYRVLTGQLQIAVPFKRTDDRSAWIPFDLDALREKKDPDQNVTFFYSPTTQFTAREQCVSSILHI
jgi:hypothetical protein